jgi:hypothetical protein
MHAVGAALSAQLKLQKCPVPVVDGPEASAKLPTHERIVIEELPSDKFGPARSQHQNPKPVLTRVVGGKITIHAQETHAGATHFEHEDRADRILDAVLFAIAVVAAQRKVSWSPVTGGFKPIPEYDAKKSELPPGAQYELLFTIDRAISQTTFDGAAKPTGVISGFNNTTQLPTGSDVETSCGG